MYNYILFDADGTLLDTKKASVMAAISAVKELLGKDVTEDEIAFTFGIPTIEAGKALGLDKPEDYVNCVDKYYSLYSEKYNTVFEGAAEVLCALKEKNIIMGVITAKTDWEYHHDFEKLPITKYFAGYVCADDAPKPSKQAYDKFFEKYSLANGKTLYVGDTAVDKQFAQNSGIDFALAAWGDCEDIAADIKLFSPNEILNLI